MKHLSVRLEVLGEIDALLRQCKGCKKPPAEKSKFRGCKNTWCAENCLVPLRVARVGKKLDKIAAAERAERAESISRLPEGHLAPIILENENGPDVGASDPSQWL